MIIRAGDEHSGSSGCGVKPTRLTRSGNGGRDCGIASFRRTRDISIPPIKGAKVPLSIYKFQIAIAAG
jgi:hypothetical protein